MTVCVVPIGAVGELYIGGMGLARGYLGMPQALLENFVPDPFAEVLDEDFKSVMGTGLNAVSRRFWWEHRRLELEYIEPHNQVKIRGVRIEIGEVVQAIACDSVIDAEVVQQSAETNVKSLLTYLFPMPQQMPRTFRLVFCDNSKYVANGYAANRNLSIRQVAIDCKW